jgi:hypothetical protein
MKAHELENAFKEMVYNSGQQRVSTSIQRLRGHKRGLHTLEETFNDKKNSPSKSPKKLPAELDPSSVVVDYPRPLRIASNDGSLECVRETLRLNMIAHNNYNPALDSQKSRLLLEGVYEPNMISEPEDIDRDVMEFIRQNKNHLCENFTISDIYDAAMVA